MVSVDPRGIQRDRLVEFSARAVGVDERIGVNEYETAIRM
jgi:hypothetical protein